MSSASFLLAANYDCKSPAKAASAKHMGDNEHDQDNEPGHESVEEIPQNNVFKKVPEKNEIEDQKMFLMRIEILEKRNQELQAETQALKAENRELSSKLESHQNVQTSPWRKIRSCDQRSDPVVNISIADRITFKEKCHDTCQVSGIKGHNICAHIWPKHFESGMKNMFGDKYGIHGESNLALLHKSVEQAFDSGQICFLLEVLQESGDKCIVVKVLDESISGTTIAGSVGGSTMTFKDLERRCFDMSDHVVSGTLLSHHSKQAIHRAFVKGWIDMPTKESYLTLANFCSPDCQIAHEVSKWLRSQEALGAFLRPPPRHLEPAESSWPQAIPEPWTSVAGTTRVRGLGELALHHCLGPSAS